MEKWKIVNKETGESKPGIYDHTDVAWDDIADCDDEDEYMQLDVVPERAVWVEADTKWLWAWPDTPHHPDW